MTTKLFAAIMFFVFSLPFNVFAQTSFNRSAQPTQHVRPFITDDARVVGNRLSQIESWYRQDKFGIEQWVLAAYGPTRWLELTLGGVFGAERLPTANEFTFLAFRSCRRSFCLRIICLTNCRVLA